MIALLLCAVLGFGTVLGIVIGAHLAAHGHMVHRTPAAPTVTAAPDVDPAALLRAHAELLRASGVLPSTGPAPVVLAYREPPAVPVTPPAARPEVEA